jgi:DNA-damage-inducible protein J
MPTTSITFRIDEELKKRFEDIAVDMGLPVTGLLNAFMKATVRDGKLPFELMSDEYAHKKRIREKLEEAQKQANDPQTKWLSHEEVFSKFREKYRYE